MPETSTRKGTSVRIENMSIKQLCNYCKVWDFAVAIQVQKHFGTFKKQVPDDSPRQQFQRALQP